MVTGLTPAKPATLVGDAKYENMPDGQNVLFRYLWEEPYGSYASQLNRDQRWMIIHYIKAKQVKAKPTVTPAAASDSAKVSMAKK